MNDKPMDPATVLEEAADLLLIHGRGKFERKNEQGQFCVVGALSQIRLGDPCAYSLIWDTPAPPEIEALAQRVEYGPDRHPTSAVMRWSDLCDDDFEIIDTLRHVAKDLRGQAVPS